MASGNLTTTLVDRAHRRGLPCELPDGAGLYFRKQTASGAAWELRYRFLGRSRYLTVGHYPDMPLAMAREEARARRVMIDKGIDPAEEKRRIQQEQRQRASFKEIADAWYLAEVIPNVKQHHVVRRALDKHLLPKLGKIAAGDVVAHDLIAIIDGIKERAPTVANDLLRYGRRIMAFARRRRIVTINPFSDLSARLDGGGTEAPRRRVLKLNELRSLAASLTASKSFGGMNLLAVKLLLAFCCRKMELLAAQWSEFDLEGASEELGPVWHLPAGRTKMGEALNVPLVPQVVEWLRALTVLSGGSAYVFPQRRRDHRHRYSHVSPDTLNAALHDVAHGLPPFTVHDLRRSGRTQLAALGIRSEVAERCLGHKLSGVEGIYNQHDYYTERRQALSQWTEVVVDVFSGEAKVVPIRQPLVAGALSALPRVFPQTSHQEKVLV